uniref:Uncharacterized protein n=1 Tax=Salix viminalis TaxID=40686 RepID=A0A6N2LEU7_SALVM
MGEVVHLQYLVLQSCTLILQQTSKRENSLRRNHVKLVRLSIAQVLTVISQKQNTVLREAYKNKKFLLLICVPRRPGLSAGGTREM